MPAEITSITVSSDVDAESFLRTAVLEFVDTVRAVERSIAATRRGDSVPEELDVVPLGEVSEEEWRAHWPSDVAVDIEPDESDEADESDDSDDDEPDDGATGEESEKSGKGAKRDRDRG